MNKEIQLLEETIEQNTITCLICLATVPKNSKKSLAESAYALGWRYDEEEPKENGDGVEYGALCPKCIEV